MTAIICFELIPEALQIASLPIVILGIVFGIVMMIACDLFVDNLFHKKVKIGDKRRRTEHQNQNEKIQNKNVKNQLERNITRQEMERRNLLKTGMIVSIGLAIHNFPEGLAIGSGFGASVKLGLSLAIAICFHDIPEGIFQSRHQVKYAR